MKHWELETPPTPATNQSSFHAWRSRPFDSLNPPFSLKKYSLPYSHFQRRLRSFRSIPSLSTSQHPFSWPISKQILRTPSDMHQDSCIHRVDNELKSQSRSTVLKRVERTCQSELLMTSLLRSFPRH